MARRLKYKPTEYIPLVVLLFLATTFVFSVALIPAMVISSEVRNIELLILALLVVISTVAALVGLLIYIILTKRA